MSMWSRIRSYAGGSRKSTDLTVPGSQNDTIELNLPDTGNLFSLVGPEGITVSKLHAGNTTRNRKVYLYQKYDSSASPATTFTNTDGAAVAGEMDLGGSDITLDATDVLVLLLRTDGTWVRLRNTDN